ncbi:MAG: hypothetical protein CVV64_01450 [Candidatus Wallbacteria bacterium HGW-Wallbacteria-1]|jgi:hypothetical protein|uniref:NERD domain-containing protein n=1 Tax=Candidatus Wallbacteria bacterium HGW-Wallbacteria-1 TaxID=2013854 RepID=A0A2N1PUX9_9BACT|nr:MAG: hypothetical protein CVV64_01450 [Candidatus Wallbacteria bacterium HGW-Wallbacteria-1]
MALHVKTEHTLGSLGDSNRREAGLLRRLSWIEIMGGILIILFGKGVMVSGQLIFGNGSSHYFWGGFLLFLGISHIFKSREDEHAAFLMDYGREGEEQVSRALLRGLPDSFWLADDLTVNLGGFPRPRTSQMDHLILGPGGLWILETKAYAGHLEGKLTDQKWRRGKDQLTNPVVQNQYHVDSLKDFLRRKGLSGVPFNSLVIMTRTDVRMSVPGWDREIVIGPDSAVARILSSASKYDFPAELRDRIAVALGIDMPVNQCTSVPTQISIDFHEE